MLHYSEHVLLIRCYLLSGTSTFEAAEVVSKSHWVILLQMRPSIAPEPLTTSPVGNFPSILVLCEPHLHPYGSQFRLPGPFISACLLLPSKFHSRSCLIPPFQQLASQTFSDDPMPHISIKQSHPKCQRVPVCLRTESST